MGGIAGPRTGLDDLRDPPGSRTDTRADGRRMVVGPSPAAHPEPGDRARGSRPTAMERSLADQPAT